MTGVVATMFLPGGKSLSKKELDQVCDILGIADPMKKNLPVGKGCTYYLLLSSNGKIPDKCPEPAQPVMALSKAADV
jgi:hypothetical protein